MVLYNFYMKQTKYYVPFVSYVCMVFWWFSVPLGIFFCLFYNLTDFWQDFQGAVECTLGSVVGEFGGRLQKPLVWVFFSWVCAFKNVQQRWWWCLNYVALFCSRISLSVSLSMGNDVSLVASVTYYARLLPKGRPVAWGTLFVSVGDQISERVAWTGT